VVRNNFKDIPIVINSRDRVTHLKALVTWFKTAGYRYIYILDNASTYGPCLEYYEQIEKDVKVVHLGENMGSRALWHPECGYLLKQAPLILSDDDILPIEECPADLSFLLKVTDRYGCKAGLSLKMDDIPQHYKPHKMVKHWEKRHWKSPIQEMSDGRNTVQLYDASVDTTFALIPDSRPFAYEAVRTGPPYTARHMPWYTDSAKPTAEDTYYENRVAETSQFAGNSWGISECFNPVVIDAFTKPKFSDYRKVRFAIDMAPYDTFYQSITREIVDDNMDNGKSTLIVEAGTRSGCSARIFLSVLDDPQIGCDDWTLFLLDPTLLPEAVELTQADHRVKLQAKTAQDASIQFDDRSIDILHIDADIDGTHPYELAQDILLSYWFKLKPNAAVILHDCTDQFPGIVRLVGELETSGWDIERCPPERKCLVSAPALATRK
jgi:hypothetical protein